MFNIYSRKLLAVVLLSLVVANCSNYRVVTPKRARTPAAKNQTTQVVSKHGSREMTKRELDREGEKAALEKMIGKSDFDGQGDIDFQQSPESVRRAPVSKKLSRAMQKPRPAKDIRWQQPAPATPSQSYTPPRENGEFPALVVTNDPPPSIIYRRGSRDTVLEGGDANRIRQDSYLEDQKIETAVTAKARELYRDMKEADRKFEVAFKKYDTLRNRNNVQISEYYSLVANISAALRTGTTPGNPILVDRWNAAQSKLNDLPKNINFINNLAVDLSGQASRASFILESVQAAYTISGAVDADHAMLRKIEDKADQLVTDLNRLIMRVNKELNRIDALLKTEGANMQTLSLGIANGELYGESLANAMHKKTWDTIAKVKTPDDTRMRKPLVIIRFDKENIDYERPLYKAVSAALDKYPSARFTLMTVSPQYDNKAKEALDRKDARNHGQDVMDSLIKMGLPASRVRIESSVSEKAKSGEIHIYLK